MSQREKILQVLEPHIRFKHTDPGITNLPAFCPFHKGGAETSPSMFIYVGPYVGGAKPKIPGSAHCFTCGRGWYFKGLLKALGVNGAIADAFIEIAEERVVRKPTRKLSFDNMVLPEKLLGKYHRAPKLLLDAGFKKPVLQEFEIGVDLDYQRVTFPIRDHLGNLVGVSGRNLGNGSRYKIYREEFQMLIHNYELVKSRVVWGLNRFYATAQIFGISESVIVCEGFKAAMWLVQNGYDRSVALIGATCSREQKALLCRVTNDVVLFLDNDIAGIKATQKLSSYLRDSLEVKIARYPVGAIGKSPDDLNKEEIQSATQQHYKPYEWRQVYAKQIGNGGLQEQVRRKKQEA